jgi:hypothetical protein
MNYMLLVYRDEHSKLNMPEGCDGLADRLNASGHLLAGGILETTSTSTSVRLREGKRLVTDGPFAETREQLAGYMLIQAKDLDEAISIAAQHPIAQVGTIEVRPMRLLVPLGATLQSQ